MHIYYVQAFSSGMHPSELMSDREQEFPQKIVADVGQPPQGSPISIQPSPGKVSGEILRLEIQAMAQNFRDSLASPLHSPRRVALPAARYIVQAPHAPPASPVSLTENKLQQ